MKDPNPPTLLRLKPSITKARYHEALNLEGLDTVIFNGAPVSPLAFAKISMPASCHRKSTWERSSRGRAFSERRRLTEAISPYHVNQLLRDKKTDAINAKISKSGNSRFFSSLSRMIHFLCVNSILNCRILRRPLAPPALERGHRLKSNALKRIQSKLARSISKTCAPLRRNQRAQFLGSAKDRFAHGRAHNITEIPQRLWNKTQ